MAPDQRVAAERKVEEGLEGHRWRSEVPLTCCPLSVYVPCCSSADTAGARKAMDGRLRSTPGYFPCSGRPGGARQRRVRTMRACARISRHQARPRQMSRRTWCWSCGPRTGRSWPASCARRWMELSSSILRQLLVDPPLRGAKPAAKALAVAQQACRAQCAVSSMPWAARNRPTASNNQALAGSFNRWRHCSRSRLCLYLRMAGANLIAGDVTLQAKAGAR